MIKKEYNVLALILVIAIIPLTIAGIVAFTPLDDEGGRVYISASDIIKNFGIRTFDGEHIIGKTLPGGKVYFESGDMWRAYKEDLTSVQVFTVGNQCVFKYELTFTNFINIYTNYLISDASENLIEVVKDKIYAGTFRHVGPFWNPTYPKIGVKSKFTYYINWDHYDFGDVRAHNEDKLISGDLLMDFDISSSPLPAVYEDEHGNAISKDFDYIGVSAAYVDSNKFGRMSEDMPEVEGIVASEAYREMNLTEKEQKAYPSGYTYEWDPEIQYSIFMTDIIGEAIKPQTEGTSMNPTRKNGLPAWDARYTGESMEDCEISLSIPKLGPLIYRWQGLLYYKEIDHIAKTRIDGGITTFRDAKTTISVVGDTAIHLINRYIQSVIKVRFNVWSSFTYELGVDQEFILTQPQEYYDDLLWSTIVYGFGGGFYHVEPLYPLAGTVAIITLIIILIIVGVVIYISYKLGKIYLSGRSIIF